jgi:hypothetical protein
MTMRRFLAGTAVLLSTLTLVTACGDDEDSPSGSTDPKVIEVTFEGDTVTPNGDRIEVERDQDVTLEITADAPGEIHVHSDPEQELEYGEGSTTVTIEGIDKPGTVDVESHSLDKVIVQLEVS